MIERGDGAVVGIEVKATARWRREDGSTLADLLRQKQLTRAFGIYLGSEVLLRERVRVLPLHRFLGQLAAGQVIG